MRKLAFLFLASCDLYEGGATDMIDSGPMDQTVPDVPTGTEAASDAPADMTSEPSPPLPCSTDASACTSQATMNGWSLVAFEPNRTTPCPANFTSVDLVASPMATAGTCACGCTSVTAPSCGVGAFSGSFGPNNNCNGGNLNYNIVNDGDCVDFGVGVFTTASWQLWNKLGLTAGTCTSPLTPDKSKITTTPMRACVPSAQCMEDVCNGMAGMGFSACIAHADDVACPGAPFTNKVAVVGTDVTPNCSACVGCSNTGSSCGAATIQFHGNTTCTDLRGTENVTGACINTGMITNVLRFKYVGTVQSPTCSPGTSSPAPDLVNKQTICCR